MPWCGPQRCAHSSCSECMGAKAVTGRVPRRSLLDRSLPRGCRGRGEGGEHCAASVAEFLLAGHQHLRKATLLGPAHSLEWSDRVIKSSCPANNVPQQTLRHATLAVSATNVIPLGDSLLTARTPMSHMAVTAVRAEMTAGMEPVSAEAERDLRHQEERGEGERTRSGTHG